LEIVSENITEQYRAAYEKLKFLKKTHLELDIVVRAKEERDRVPPDTAAVDGAVDRGGEDVVCEHGDNSIERSVKEGAGKGTHSSIVQARPRGYVN
jgi:hypothetical protein